MFGADESYLLLNGYNLQYGRNLNNLDVRTGRNVCIDGMMWQVIISAKIFKGLLILLSGSIRFLQDIGYTGK
jgi:hypothetical protein